MNDMTRVTTPDFALELSKKLGCTLRDAKIIIEAFCETFLEFIAKNPDDTTIYFNNFGRFKSYLKAPRTYFDQINGVRRIAPAIYKVKFKLSRAATERIKELNPFLTFEVK